MTTLIMITALLAIAVIGAWGWLRHDQARKHAERRARKESERIAKEKVVAKAREEARLQAEAEERSRREAEAKENGRLAEEQRLAAEKLAAEAEAKQRAEAEAREKARVAAEEEQQAEVRRQAAAQAKADAAAPPETPPPDEPPVEDREAVPAVAEVTEKRESEAAPPKEKQSERVSVSPDNRGGRSRETVPKKEGGGEKKRRTHTPKPEIVCWKQEREWIVAVELPDDFPERQNVTVVQDGKPLGIDETENGCWRLAQLHGEVVVRVTDAEHERSPLSLGSDDCLIFKLNGEDRGRHVKRPRSGSCLAIAPDNWNRDDALAGVPRIAPEDVCLSGYRAHFFDLSIPGKIAFRDSTDRCVVIGSGGPLFQFVGEQAHDASESLGPLFAGAPPRMRVANGSWDSVRTIVLGEEGRGAGKWRKAFKPNPDSPEQIMPVELTNRRAGWYFVRFYDDEDELVDSLDFRFCAGLRQIRTQPYQPLPSAVGHDTVTVELKHESEWCVSSASPSQDGVMIERKGDGTILRIPPLPDRDLTRWKVGVLPGPQVETALLMERVWWAATDMDKPPQQWRDTSLNLTVEDFAATSEKAIWLRLPKPRWTDCVLAGFQPERRRPYAPRVTERMVALPLRDFSDAPVLADRTRDCTLKVWVNGYEAVVATVPADTVEAPLDVTRISACHMARILTRLRTVTHGPLRQLLKETRRRYRRLRRSRDDRNVEFIKEALCVIAIVLQLTDSHHVLAPRDARRWKSKARLAGKEFPDTMRQVWRRFRELEGQATGKYYSPIQSQTFS